MEMFSVVPRVTDAHPQTGNASIAAVKSLFITDFPQTHPSITQLKHEIKGKFAQSQVSLVTRVLEGCLGNQADRELTGRGSVTIEAHPWHIPCQPIRPFRRI